MMTLNGYPVIHPRAHKGPDGAGRLEALGKKHRQRITRSRLKTVTTRPSRARWLQLALYGAIALIILGNLA